MGVALTGVENLESFAGDVALSKTEEVDLDLFRYGRLGLLSAMRARASSAVKVGRVSGNRFIRGRVGDGGVETAMPMVESTWESSWTS